MTTHLAFDFETHLIRPGHAAPKPVCAGYYVPHLDKRGLLLWPQARAMLKAALQDKKVMFHNQNIAFDMLVLAAHAPETLPFIFDAYDEGRIRCTMVREMLRYIRQGRFPDKQSLDKLSQYYLGENVEGKHGPDAWRLRYAELDGVPLEQWPKAAYDYALYDPEYAWRVAQAQAPEVDEDRQSRIDFSLALMGAWGLRTDEYYVDRFDEELHDHVDHVVDELTREAIFREDGTKDEKYIKSLVCAAFAGTEDTDLPRTYTEKLRIVLGDEAFATGYGLRVLYNNLKRINRGDAERLFKDRFGRKPVKGEPVLDILTVAVQGKYNHTFEWSGLRRGRFAEDEKVLDLLLSLRNPDKIPLTGKGGIKKDEETLLLSGHPMLKKLAGIMGDQKVLSAFIPVVRKGIHAPLHPRWNVLVASGRTSCRGPNLQQMPRKKGIRECFVPRPGNVFIFCDYSTAELRSLSQILLELFGHSEMAAVIQRGEDLHLSFAAALLNITYKEAEERLAAGDPAVTAERQFSKIANFGYPGGLGHKTFVAYAAGYGTEISEEASYNLKQEWLWRFPEMREYFSMWGDLVEQSGGDYIVDQFRSGRLRGGVGYCDGCNTLFQGLTADGAKDALYRVSKECYVDHGTALFGCRPILFIHDEIGLEAPEDRAHEAALRLAQVMKEEMEKWTPDVPAETDAAICRRWRKGAKAIFVDGRMIPYEDRPLSKKDKATLFKLLSSGGDDWTVGVGSGIEMDRVRSIRQSDWKAWDPEKG